MGSNPSRFHLGLESAPDWDGLRGESRFEKIVADLAPKKAEK
jgi:hypothetical protein